MQSFLDVSQAMAFPKASGMKENNSKYAKYYSCRTAHFAASGGPVDSGGPVLRGAMAIPLSCLYATFLLKRAFTEDLQFSALKRPVPFSPPIPVNLFCLLKGKKHIVQEHGFQGKVSKQEAVLLLYQKLSWIMGSLMGLNRSWTVAWALTDAAVYVCYPEESLYAGVIVPCVGLK